MAANITDRIKDTARAIMPANAKVILFGSRARGDWHNGSDWDVLVLLDKDNISERDHELYSYPFWALGWETDEMIHHERMGKTEWQRILQKHNI